MANTKIPIELSSTPGIVDNSNATAITIDSSENVGIGTSSPSRQLTVFHATNATHDIKTSDANLLFNQAGHNSFLGNSSISGYLQLFTNNGNSVVNMLANGDVGIGTTTPTSKLQVATANGTLSHFGGIGATNTHYTGISLGYSEAANANYRKTAIVQEQIGDGAARGHLHFLVDTASDSNSAVLADSKMMIQGTTGNVGVGTTSPDRLFHVKGSASTVAKFASTGNIVYIELNAADQAGADAGYIKYNNTKEMSFWTSDTERIIVDSSGNLKPKTDAGYSGHSDLGSSSLRYEDAFVRDGVTTGSDRNEKENITESNLGLTFIKELQPVSYTWKNNSSNRTHYGLIAQDIETWLSDNDKSNTDFAALIKEDISEEQDGSNYRYGLRYTEFISPLIKAIQEQQTIIDDLKSRIEKLEE